MTTPVLITAQDLPLYCPRNGLWSSHPRVFLELDVQQQAICPYCGAQYQLRSNHQEQEDAVEKLGE